MSTEDEVLIDHPAPGVARITLNRPAHRNALTPPMRERLRETVQAQLADPTVRALVLTGAQGHFCAGGDVARLAALPKEELPALLRAGHALVRALIESPKPVVAAICGAAAGGGAGLALACDMLVMGSSAKLVLPFHKLGLVPDYGVAYTLPRRVGVARAHQMMLRPQPLEAERALESGAADAVVEDDQVQEAAIQAAIRMASQSALALAWTKRLMLAQSPPLQDTLDLEVEAQAACFASPEFSAGAAAFLARKGE